MDVDYPSPDARERLAFLQEEMGETQQAVGKVERHGFFAMWDTATNRDKLELEAGHVLAALALLFEAGDLRASHVQLWALAKLKNMQPYLHQQVNAATAELAHKALSKLELPRWS